MRERQEGRYYGLGIPIQVIDGDITVMSHLRRVAGLSEGAPPRRRHRAAIGRRSDTKGWTSEQAVAQAERPEGHEGQHLASAAAATTGLIDMDVERDEVNITTVRGAFMIDKRHRLHQAG